MATPYIISSFRAGISDDTDRGLEGSFKHGWGLAIHNRKDALTCKQAMVEVFGASNTTQVGIGNFFVNSSDGSTYVFGSTGSIFAINGEDQVNLVYNDENGAIKGAAEWQLEDGVKYLFWATHTSLARKLIPGTTTAPDSGSALWSDATQDWKTTLDGADWHTMTPASGQLMIANNNNLARVKYDGSYEALALDVRPGNVLKTLEERDDYVTMGSGRLDNTVQGHIWSWIPSADTWVQKKRIPESGVNALITAEFPYLQAGTDGEIFLADYQEPASLAQIPGGGYANPGGVAIEEDNAIFGIHQGTYPGIYSFGRRRRNRPLALNYAYRMAQTVAGSSITTISAVTSVGGTLYATWGTTDGSTSDYGIDKVSNETKATGRYEGLEFDAGDAAPYRKKFDGVMVVMEPLPSGCSISIQYKTDYASSWNYAVTATGATTFSTAGAVTAFFSVTTVGNIYEVAVDLNPSGNDAPTIHRVATYVGDGVNQYA